MPDNHAKLRRAMDARLCAACILDGQEIPAPNGALCDSCMDQLRASFRGTGVTIKTVDVKRYQSDILGPVSVPEGE